MSRLFRSTSLVSLNTLLSRILGFARDIVIAYYFGATPGSDAFFVAFRIPNFLRDIFAEGAFSQAFVPVLARYSHERPHEETRRFIDHVSGTLTLFLTILVVLGVIFGPFVTALFAPGWFFHHDPRFLMATHMFRIIFPYILLISLTAMGSAILNTYDSFGIPAFTPTWLNIVMIIVPVLLFSYFETPVYALAWSVLLAGFIQLFFQWPFLYRKELLPRFRLDLKDKGVRQVVRLMVPALIGASVVQISLLLDSVFASFLKVGSVSWLYYSSRLMNFPLGVFGVAIMTVILPKLSRQHVKKDREAYSKTLDWAIRLILFIGVPSAVGMMFLSGPLMATLFETGKFTAYDVAMAKESLMAFSLGIAAFMMIKVLASAFYATQDIATPVKIAVTAVTIKILLNLMLIHSLQHMGLALSTSLAAFVNMSLLLYILRRRKIYVPERGWTFYGLRLILANLVMGGILFLWTAPLSVWVAHGRFWRIEHLTELMAVAMTAYFCLLFVLGLRLRDIWAI